MIGKTFFGSLMAVVFTLGAVSLAFPQAVNQELTGKITNIVGNKVTIKAANGSEVSGEVTSTQGLRIGDAISVKVAEGGKAKRFVSVRRIQNPGEIRGFNPQPEPPAKKKGFNPQPEPPAKKLY
jgi:hypothetical protein